MVGCGAEGRWAAALESGVGNLGLGHTRFDYDLDLKFSIRRAYIPLDGTEMSTSFSYTHYRN
jgi:hypothetical protein